ncbi:uncharacterized protein RSE6_05144 [Rhynchosporium secalis]|uniref:Uncharacterized protein n=1 Tax=Rhynchosporium secalis TaxID=38038 RepID=A0A1E1M709_RHYSE|nr:uncharacterized protein RSE6_05144 [Rhynchosporium secalis]
MPRSLLVLVIILLEARAILYESLADNLRVEADLEEEVERKEEESKGLIKL